MGGGCVQTPPHTWAKVNRLVVDAHADADAGVDAHALADTGVDAHAESSHSLFSFDTQNSIFEHYESKG